MSSVVSSLALDGVGLDPLRDIRHREARAARRYGYDSCPDCGGPKRTHSQRCRDCWSAHPRRRWSDNPNSGRAVARDNFKLAETCERCGTARAVDRHHIDGNACNNIAENIASLCRRCHMEADGRIGGRLRRDYCRNGHLRSEENTYVSPRGQRTCLICKRNRKAQR